MFMNTDELAAFERHWKEFGENRLGILYGYFCEDPDYELGVRVIVETIYEPPQSANTYGSIKYLEDPLLPTVNMIAEGLQLQPVGWIFTSRNKDCYMSPEESIQAAKFQNQH